MDMEGSYMWKGVVLSTRASFGEEWSSPPGNLLERKNALRR